MVRRGVVLDDGRLRVEYLQTTAETDGALHEMRARYAARSPWPPAHHHPAQDERFQVEQGRLHFRVDGRQHLVEAGGELIIPRGAVHQVRNAGEVAAVAVWQTRPALRTGEFLQAIHAARTGGNLLDVAATVRAFGDVFCLDVAPRPAVDAAIAALAAAARLLGRQPPA